MSNTKIKPIAYYLPQFHQIPENDKWWGEGFTEWVNVKKAKPLFPGHVQPSKPYEYYSLSNMKAMHKQIDMAKEYGLYGFCFYHYWFSGKRLLEGPVDRFLADKTNSADFPFMICWANENWTRSWDGSSEDVLIGQEHSKDDHDLVVKDLIRHFKDSRYICDDGSPVFILYHPRIIANIHYLIQELRKAVTRVGFPGIKILCTEAFQFRNEEGFDIDGIVQFPPHLTFCKQPEKIHVASTIPGLKLYDYNETIRNNVDFYERDSSSLSRQKIKTMYPCAFPGWDNSPRRPDDSASVWVNTSIEGFRKWLYEAKKFTLNYNRNSEKFVFVNAWNEWAEGAFIEPDQVNGFAKLEALRDVVDS